MIALLIGWEAASRLLTPISIAFNEAIPIACLGLAVNLASVWLLGGGHDHAHGHRHHGHEDNRNADLGGRTLSLRIHENGVPPRFRILTAIPADALRAETVRSDGARQVFGFVRRDGELESVAEIPEPHESTVMLSSGSMTTAVGFEEHPDAHGATHHDNNIRAAVVHVMADAAVSILVIAGLLLARTSG